MGKINVLSLFDGMSCGQIALKKKGIEAEQYFASEIKPNAIKVTMDNFGNQFCFYIAQLLHSNKSAVD